MRKAPNAAEVLEHFKSDTASHVMTVLRDDGVNRHLLFKRPDSGFNWFEILTWGSHLYIGGDCGTYVFERLEDMFRFFRRSDAHDFGINPSYWAEKIQAADKCDGIEEFNWASFEEDVRDYVKQAWDQDDPAEKAIHDKCLEAVNEELACAEQDEHGACALIRNFEWHYDENGAMASFEFDDWERSSKVYTHRYLWNCFAIVWAIRVYDTHKASANNASAAAWPATGYANAAAITPNA